MFREVAGITALNLRRQVARKIPKGKSKGYRKRADRKYLKGRTYRDYKRYVSDNPDVLVTQMDTVYNDETNESFIQTFKFVDTGILFALYQKSKIALSMKQGLDLLETMLGSPLELNLGLIQGDFLF